MPITGREIPISNQDKILFPQAGLTKGDLADHVQQVADVMLPHLRDRPLTLRRYPDGIDAEGFVQKQATEHFPEWLDTVRVPLREGGTQRAVLASSEAALTYLADQATIEFHIWPSTVTDLERPDLMVIDIDPPDGSAAIGEIRSVARRLRDLFGELGLLAYLQATGGRGFHVLAPLDRSAGFDTVRRLAADIADVMAADDPRHLTTEFRKEHRGKRTFLDVNRNGYGQTFIAPYSVRARPGASCAVPLDWGELAGAWPTGWDMRRLHRRLAQKTDPWQRLHDDRLACSPGEAARRLAAIRD
ncbi:non-homologous end-joining DNA ligase [Haloechinothrix halophila]|uniref:non-homologous end-joining DNA ligase n=1 Tax=Haloechinothrix halophila TaxID=1069073 RepID=UPI000406A8A8|nr:non-homologous end-joining DNA ligase [Haloechinothrix halophila]